MVETNVLLSIGLTIVSNFAHVVSIPSDPVPMKPDDIAAYYVDTFYTPPTLFLHTRGGVDLEVKDGTISYYSAREFYRKRTNLAQAHQGALLTSSEALARGTSILKQLIRSSDVPSNWADQVRIYDGNGDGDNCYRVAWLSTNQQLRYDAALELDRNSGEVIWLDLRGKQFADEGLSLEISNKVCKPDRRALTAAPTKEEIVSPGPGADANAVARAIGSWLWLCNRLSVNPGPETNLSLVSWGQSDTYTNAEISTNIPTLQIRFRNGACFDACGDVAFSHFSANACFTGRWFERPRRQYLKQFEGTILFRWNDLATNLERVIRDRLGVPSGSLARFKAGPAREPDELGARGTKRLVVDWRHWPRTEGFVPISESTLGFSAEFDLENGELEWIYFHDAEIISAIARQQGITASGSSEAK